MSKFLIKTLAASLLMLIAISPQMRASINILPTFIATGSSDADYYGTPWDCYYLISATAPADGWTTSSAPTGFTKGTGSFSGGDYGPEKAYSTKWTDFANKNLYVVRSLTLTQSQLDNMPDDLNLLYIVDQDATFYVNGTQVDYKNGWTDLNWAIKTFSKSLLKAGENVFAVSVGKGTGGQFLDFGVNCSTISGGLPTRLEAGIYPAQYLMTNSEASEGWNNTGYTGTDFTSGVGPFHGQDYFTPIAWTTWTDRTNKKLYVRRTFTLATDEIRESLIGATLKITYDYMPTVYLNGHELYSATNYSSNVNTYTTVEISETDLQSYLVTGENVLAVLVNANDGAQYLDYGIEFSSNTVDETIGEYPLPTWAENGKYKCEYAFIKRQYGDAQMYPNDNNKDWAKIDFNFTDEWQTGTGPFSNGTDFNSQATTWNNSGSSSVYVRRTFNLTSDQLKDAKAGDIYLKISFDQYPHIYLNGTEITNFSGWSPNSTSYSTYKLTDVQKDLLVEGKNVLAVACLEGIGGQFVDFGLYTASPTIENFPLLTWEQGGTYKCDYLEQSRQSTSIRQPNNANTDWGDNTTAGQASMWKSGDGPFANSYAKSSVYDGEATLWQDGGANAMFVRRTFYLTSEQLTTIKASTVVVARNFDQFATLKLNGNVIGAEDTYLTGVGTYETITLTDEQKDYLVEGMNVLAMTACEGGGSQYMDFGIYTPESYSNNNGVITGTGAITQSGLSTYVNSQTDYTAINLSDGALTKTVTTDALSGLLTGNILATVPANSITGQNIINDGVCDNLVLTDGSTFAPETGFVANNATYNRTMNGYEWATICLPYAISSDKNVKVYKLNDDYNKANTITVDEVETLDAGTPALIHKENASTSVTLTGSGDVVAQPNNPSAGFIGYFARTTVTAEDYPNAYYIYNNEFYRINQNFIVTPFRAFLNATNASSNSFSILVDDDPTGINGASADDAAREIEGVYSVSGVKQSSLQKGINIVRYRNGKTQKVILK